MRIGILGHGFLEWGGGIHFIRLVCESLLATGKVELHLLIPSKGPRANIRNCIGVAKGFVKFVLGKPNAQFRLQGNTEIIDEWVGVIDSLITVHEIDLGSAAIASAARKLQLDAVLPAIFPLELQQVPWVGYIADFQHRHLPALFSAREIARRERYFSQMLLSAKTVIVNGKAVEVDIREFYPKSKTKIVALPFSAAPIPTWFDYVPSLSEFWTNNHYFIICNQFWSHKDHRTAFRALSLIRERWPHVLLICTGATVDHRNPKFFEELMLEGRALGIEDNLKILGMIPKRNQIELMLKALAVIQPTLFEGGPGGGSVYDAVSLGIPSIVSDIPINLELNEPGISFFRAGDPQSLAAAMDTRLLAGYVAKPDREVLIAAGRRRSLACGETLIRAIL